MPAWMDDPSFRLDRKKEKKKKRSCNQCVSVWVHTYTSQWWPLYCRTVQVQSGAFLLLL